MHLIIKTTLYESKKFCQQICSTFCFENRNKEYGAYQLRKTTTAVSGNLNDHRLVSFIALLSSFVASKVYKDKESAPNTEITIIDITRKKRR
jgi:hypothetical protein